MSYDTTGRYHRGNQASTDANEITQQNKSRDIERIKAFFHRCGEQGATCFQLEQAIGISHQTASARMTDLKTTEYDHFLVPVRNADGTHRRGPSASGPTRAEMWKVNKGGETTC